MLVGGLAVGAPFIVLGGLLVAAGLLTLRMWMWQKAYEGKATT